MFYPSLMIRFECGCVLSTDSSGVLKMKKKCCLKKNAKSRYGQSYQTKSFKYFTRSDWAQFNSRKLMRNQYWSLDYDWSRFMACHGWPFFKFSKVFIMSTNTNTQSKLTRVFISKHPGVSLKRKITHGLLRRTCKLHLRKMVNNHDMLRG